MWIPALRYLAFALAALVGPGIAIQRLARVCVDAALVLPLGMVLASGTYWLGLVLGASWLFPLVLISLDLSLLLARAGPRRVAQGTPTLRGAAPAFLALVGVFAVSQYRWNREGPSGEFLLDPMGDHPLHVGIAHELAIGYPPQVPGLAGIPLKYHFGADLVRSAALRWAGVDPFDSINRFELTLYALALVLALRGVAQRLGAPAVAVALVPWTLLATDFSFLVVLLGDTPFWTDLLRGNLLISLLFANPVVPALALTLGALISLWRHEAGEGRGWLVLAVLQVVALPFFKVFMAGQLALGLGVAAVLSRGSRRRAVLLMALGVLAGVVFLVSGSGGGDRVSLTLAPLELVRASLEDMQLEAPTGGRLLAWSLAWLAASLGLRMLGVPAALGALRSGSGAAAALAVVALSGWPLGLLFRIAARETPPGQEIPSASIYFLEQSGCVLWIFTAIALATLAGRLQRRWPVWLGAAVLSVPSTVEFVAQRARQQADPLPAAMVRAMRALRAVSEPGAVVLQRPRERYPPAPVILIGRRVAYDRFTPYLTQFAPLRELTRRHEEIVRFFRTKDRSEALAVAGDFGAGFLCLYGGDRVRFDGRGVLEPIYEEPDARVYRIRIERPAAPPPVAP